MTPTLHIQLLSDFHLEYDWELLDTVNTARLQSLLTYLVLHRDAPQPCQHLALLLWPDSTEAQASTNLLEQVHDLFCTLPAPDAFLYAITKGIEWQPEGPFALDVSDFGRVTGRETPVRFESPGEPLAGVWKAVAPIAAAHDAYDARIDMTDTARTYGIELTPAEKAVRNMVAGAGA